MIDIITVFHNNYNYEQALHLQETLDVYECDKYTMYLHSNIENNKGFSKACNLEAAKGDSRIIGFINPDAIVEGPFIDLVEKTIVDDIVITGNSFGKPKQELKIWGVKNWVCGATFFVSREWFEKLGGFDERFIWSHEETDMIRTTESLGKNIVDLDLPILHSSPHENSEEDSAYKKRHFDLAAKEYYKKWSR